MNFGLEPKTPEQKTFAVPFYGAVNFEKLKEIASTKIVGNIEVDEYYTIEKLNDLKITANNTENLRGVLTNEDRKKYLGFILQIEGILEARKILNSFK